MNALYHYPCARNAYQYTYATPTDVGPFPRMQLEFWVPKGKKGGHWMQIPDPVPGLYKTWRKVLPGHTHKDKLPHSIAMRPVKSDRTREMVCAAYCAWAKGTGLTSVTIFAGDDRGSSAAYALGLGVREVDPAEFIGEAPAAELDMAEAA